MQHLSGPERLGDALRFLPATGWPPEGELLFDGGAQEVALRELED